MMLAHNPPVSLAAGWAIMVVAMMGPMLLDPIRHIWARSFARRRASTITLYLAGYGAVWMVVGALLLTLAFILTSIAGNSSWPLVVALAAATVWQFSPLKQMCLNRGHVHVALAAFGWPAARDALKFGVVHGFWCVGTCSMLMLAALLFAKGHLLAMAAATAFLVTERFERPATPQWSWRLPSKAIRIALTQMRGMMFPNYELRG
jgi:predicted metal-binding membrane protein